MRIMDVSMLQMSSMDAIDQIRIKIEDIHIMDLSIIGIQYDISRL